MDFHKKLTSGEDTTDLKRRLGQLQVEVSVLIVVFKVSHSILT